MALNPANCHRQLTGLAQKDPFLSQVDQRPLLDGILQQMDSAVKDALDQADRKLAETGQKLDSELTEAAGFLRKANEQLGEEFAATLATKPLSPAAVSGLARSIEGRILCSTIECAQASNAACSPYVHLGKPIAVLIEDRFDYRFSTRFTIKAYVHEIRLERILASDILERVKKALQEQGLAAPMIGKVTTCGQQPGQPA